MLTAAATALRITPDRPLPLAGYSGRDTNFGRIESELEADILLLDDGAEAIAIVGIDTLFASEKLQQRICEMLGSRSVRLLLVASHTHSAPGLDDGKPALGLTDAAYLDQVGAQIGQAIRVLDLAKVPATFHYGHGSAPGSIYRRRTWISLARRPTRIGWNCVMAPNTRAITDTRLQMLVIGSMSAPSAILWSWPCHPVASPHQGAVSADFPGVVRAVLRRHFDDAELPIVYLPGFAGDIRPDIRGKRFSVRNVARHALLPITPFGPNTPSTFRSFCMGISDSAIAVAGSAVRIHSGPALQMRSAQFPIGRYLQPERDISMEIVALRAGDLSLMFAGAEVCSPYYDLLACDPAAPHIVTGYTGSVFGYLPTEAQLAEGGYEASGFFSAFGLEGSFRNSFEADFVRTVKVLQSNMESRRRQ